MLTVVAALFIHLVIVFLQMHSFLTGLKTELYLHGS